MRHSDPFLIAMGRLLSDYASLADCTYAEVCSELSISPQTYSGVWKGQVTNFAYYRKIFLYIYDELYYPWQRKKMQEDFMKLFLRD